MQKLVLFAVPTNGFPTACNEHHLSNVIFVIMAVKNSFSSLKIQWRKSDDTSVINLTIYIRLHTHTRARPCRNST